MRRHILAAALLLAATFAAPAAANPIAFVSGPSPVAIVSGILTVSGPEVAGQFVLEATNGAVFAGNWPGFSQRTPVAATPASGAVVTGWSAPGRPAPPGGGASAPGPAAPAAPTQLIGQLFGFPPTAENAQAVFVTALIIALVPNPGPVVAGPIGVLAPSDQVNGLTGANVPEPGTIVLLSSGLAGLVVARRRKKKAQARL